MNTTITTPRLSRELKTVATMIGIYCQGSHQQRSGELCSDCTELLSYATARLQRCQYGETKPKCSACTIHCYMPTMRERIRAVMKYAGPRMALKHPVLSLGHMIDGIGKRAGTGLK